jgi:hypothetical protein
MSTLDFLPSSLFNHQTNKTEIEEVQLLMKFAAVEEGL